MTANGIVASLVANISGSAAVSHMVLFRIGGKNAVLSCLTGVIEMGLVCRLAGRLEYSLLLQILPEIIGGVMVDGLGDGSLSSTSLGPVWIFGLSLK